MKTYLIAIIALIFTGLSANSCKKDNINGDSKKLIEGSYITLDSTINTNLDFSNSAATVSISVSEYGSPVASINIYLATGSDRTDTSGWVLIKNVPYTGTGTILTVTTAEIAAALAPDSLAPGTQYALENEVITKDGRKFSDANTPDSYTSFPAYNFAFNWPATAVCPFNAAETTGNYKVVTDSWDDYSAGDIIAVTADATKNQISFLGYPSTAAGGENQKNTVVNVDPASGSATIAMQATGDYAGTSAAVEGSGFVFSCTGIITLTMTVFYGGTPYAGQVLTLQKVQ